MLLKRISFSTERLKGFVGLVSHHTSHLSTSVAFAQTIKTSSDITVHPKPQVISNNVAYYQATQSPFSTAERPLVLLYGWLEAKSKHIYKYSNFYLARGYDVVYLKVKIQELLLPKKAQAAVEEILNFVQESERSQQPLLYHGFSVGGYLYGETLVKINSENSAFKQVGERLRGQIYDSPIDYEGVPAGIPKAITDWWILQKPMELGISSYMKLFPKSVTYHYMMSSNQAKSNTLCIPSLILFSAVDSLTSSRIISDTAAHYKAQGVHVQVLDFKDSRHVQHFQKYPVTYISVLNSFLKKIGLPDEIVQEEDKSMEKMMEKTGSKSSVDKTEVESKENDGNVKDKSKLKI